MNRGLRQGLLTVAVVALGAVVAVLIVATNEPPAQQNVETPVPLVRVLEADPRTLQLRVETHGTVAPRTESDLVPEVSGPVVWVSPSLVSGGFFDAGESLLRIDPRDYEAALERARANVERRESQLDRARKERVRQRTLQGRAAASESRLDDAENAARVAAADLRDARAALDQAERDLARSEIRAPFTGRVREKRVDVGQFVNRGQTVARLYATDYAEVRLPVPDDELAFLDLPMLYEGDPQADREGPSVQLSARFAGQHHAWMGRVVRTEGEIDPRSRMVNVVARVESPYARVNGRPPLAVGLFVEAEILGRVEHGVFVLPRAALREGNRVHVVDDQDRLRLREVDVLRRERERVVIRSGLEAGDRVSISPLAAVADGMRVRPVSAGTSPDEPRSIGAETATAREEDAS